MMQNKLAAPGLTGKEFKLPWFVRLALALPVVRNVPAKMMAFGPHRVKLKPRPAVAATA